MVIMGCRLQNLIYTIEGFLRTQIPLIGYNGTSLQPFWGFDDIGIFVLIPQMVRSFNLSLGQAINYFFYGILVLGFFFGILGFFLLYKTFLTRTFSCLALFLLAYFIRRYDVGDVYTAYLGATLGIIPLFLYFLKEKSNSYLFVIYLFLSGIVLETLHYIRSHSSTATLIFIGMSLACASHFHFKKKLLLSTCLLLGMTCSFIYFKTTIGQYETYARTQFQEFTDFPTIHPFWHAVYIGLGFLSFENKDNIQMNDEYAFATVQKHNPSITLLQTSDYESIIKSIVLSLFKSRPFFILFTFFAKLGILFFYLLLFAHVGLLAALFRKKEWRFEIPFLCATSFTMLFPLLTLPSYWYSLGFITMATIYGIISTNEALSILNFKKLAQRYKTSYNIASHV